ncbi:MAG: hypothetical protein IJI14_17670 [Anaerolineaceae bacterium]|nr:hypothetical protein [Anaerolineaceae bacterium]
MGQIKMPEFSLTNILIIVSLFFTLNRIFRWKSKLWKFIMNTIYAVSLGVTVYRLVTMFGL